MAVLEESKTLNFNIPTPLVTYHFSSTSAVTKRAKICIVNMCFWDSENLLKSDFLLDSDQKR